MWRSLSKALLPLSRSETLLLTAENVVQQQLRTTFILKRRFPPRLNKKGHPPKNLRSRQYIYDLVKDTNVEKQPDIDVILTSFVDGLGNAGDKVSVKPQYAYNNLLLPGLAVYTTPENVEKYQNFEVKDVQHYSSPNALKIMETLQRLTLGIIMNKDTSWTIKPWHIRTSFRKCGFIVPEDAITIPAKPIKGPDMNIEGKEFYATVTINKTERTKVRCRIHHWSTNITERLPYVEGFWKTPGELLFHENAEELKSEPPESN